MRHANPGGSPAPSRFLTVCLVALGVLLLPSGVLGHGAGPTVARSEAPPEQGDSTVFKRIYIANNDHTDLFWTADDEAYRESFLRMIDYYLDRADATEDAPPALQARFCCDGSHWMWVYQQKGMPRQFERLMDRVRDGHVTINLAPLCISPGGLPSEAVLRGMYYPGTVEREHDVRFRVAHACENPTHPLGLVSLWAGSGARYCWGGNYGGDTRVPTSELRNRRHEIFWWTGRGGRRLLMKWPSLVGGDTVGGYAEARRPAEAIGYVEGDAEFQRRYPYEIVSLFGKGWDDRETLTTELEEVARRLTSPERQVIVSNQRDFYEDFEATCGEDLPSVTESYGNEWDLYVATLAALTARLKRATEKLRGAEAMATLASLHGTDVTSDMTGARERAWTSMGLYAEHDINMVGKGDREKAARLAWQRERVRQVQTYVDELHFRSRHALGEMIETDPDATRFFVFNPLSHARTGAADLPFEGKGPAHVVDVRTGDEVPCQWVGEGPDRRLRVLARGVPPVGYRVYEVRPGEGRQFGPAAEVQGDTIENAVYRLTITGRGAITHLVDKRREDRDFARALNDLGPGKGTLEIEDAGPVSVTLKATAADPLAHVTRLTLFRDSDRIELNNRISENFDAPQTWTFGFNLTDPDVWHEECGAVLRARPVDDGGHYAVRCARVDWLTLNHFADMSGADGAGVTLSNADCSFMKLGESQSGAIDTATPQMHVLVGGRVGGDRGSGIRNQGGAERFHQSFALRTHGGYSEAEAVRMAMEHQNPLIAGRVTGEQARCPADAYSLLRVSDPRVLVWALKPAEEGIEHGVIVRAWNHSEEAVQVTVALELDLESARYATHIETDIGEAALEDGALSVTLPANRMETYRLLPLER